MSTADSQDRDGSEPAVLDLAQLARIQGTHRGFLYQHVYAVVCILSSPTSATARVRVERDDDVELVRATECVYVQVKTRLGSLLAPSDIDGVLERFDALRKAHERGERPGTARFAIVANVELGPTLAQREWPPDVVIVTPSSAANVGRIGIPTPRSTVEQLLQDAQRMAQAFTMSALKPESLVAKLVGLVAQAAAGELPERSFAADNLDRTCELVAAQLRPFPVVGTYRPQTREPPIANGGSVLAVVGHAGDGKSAWAAEMAAHTTEVAVYVPCSAAPGEQLSSRLVDAVATTLATRGDVRMHDLVVPGRIGTDALALLDRQLAQRHLSVIAFVDDIHHLSAESVVAAVRAAPAIRFVLLGRPSQTMSETAALLGVTANILGGWSNDVVAALLADAGCSTRPAEVDALRQVTDGAPLFVLQAVRMIQELGGDTGAYATSLARGTTHGRPAQEVLLEGTVTSLPSAAGRVASGLASVDVGLTADEWFGMLSEVLGLGEGEARRAIRLLLDLHVANGTVTGIVSLHDAFRSLLTERFLSTIEVRALRERAVAFLQAQLVEGRGEQHIVGYMRTLALLGRFSEIADVSNALSEWIRETGTISQVRDHLEAAASSNQIEDEDRFWALDTLTFFDVEDDRVDSATVRLQSMEPLATSLDDHARGALLHKRVLVAFKRNDVVEVRRLVNGWSGSATHVRILKYQLALAEAQSGQIEKAVQILHGVADEYLAKIGLTRQQVFAANLPQLRAMMRPDASAADARHLADCYDAIVKITHSHAEYRAQGALPAFWSAKFYELAGATRSVLRASQEIVDVMLGVHDDPEEARRFIEASLLPGLARSRLPDMAVPIRAQYAVVCAHCGDYDRAIAEIESLAPYVSGLPSAAQEEIERQRDLIQELRASGPTSPERLAARRQRHAEQARISEQLRSMLIQAPSRQSPQSKVPRNSRCTCGSGIKYKRCCGKP